MFVCTAVVQLYTFTIYEYVVTFVQMDVPDAFV